MKSDKEQKKVFAEYHNPRYTREWFDGVGNWKYCNESKASHAKLKRYNFNADLVDEHGRHQIASVNDPVVGMQSQNDPDYLEYQVLLAKLAGIDGFMTDFRHIDDPAGMEQVRLLKEAAETYGFEIGVDWCDAQIFYSLKQKRPELDTREKQIEYCKGIFRFLLEQIYDGKTGASIQGHPAVWLFGDGFSFEEYRYLKEDAKQYTAAEPWYFRRAMMECGYDGKEVRYRFDTGHDYFSEAHRGEIAGPFGWIPFRLRDAVQDGKPYWDVYASQEDCIRYLDTLFAHVRENRDRYQALVSVVTPGMDQRGCAAWGRPICLIERSGGEIYRAMWEYQIQHRDEVDAVFIAGWNDYNEGHEIEPTLQNGWRELELTARYTRRLKGIEAEFSDEWLRLPETLFRLRKRTARLQRIGFDVSPLAALLDRSAHALASESCREAEERIKNAQIKIEELESGLCVKEFRLSDFITLKQSRLHNCSAGAQIQVNRALEHCGGSRAVDGERMRSYWKTDGAPSRLELTLPKEMEIETMVIQTGLLERSDTPNWPMIASEISIEYQSGGEWRHLAGITDNSDYEVKLHCGVTAKRFRISSGDRAGVVIRNIDLLTREDQGGGMGCYDGLLLKAPEERAAEIRGRYFEGFLEFDYLDLGYASFAVRSASKKFSTVCEITKDGNGEWKHAKVALYHCNTTFDHSLSGADLLFEGDAEVKNIAVSLNIIQKNIEGESR